MSHNLASPAFKLYATIATTAIALAYLGSRVTGVSLPLVLGAKVVMSGLLFLCSSKIIELQYSWLYGATEISSERTDSNGTLIRDAMVELTGKESPLASWSEGVTLYSYKGKEANAFAVGLFDSQKAVYVSSGLIKALESYSKLDENSQFHLKHKALLKAVLAHELGHVSGNHSAVGLLTRCLDVVTDGVIIYIQNKWSKQKEESQSKKKDQEEESSSINLYVAYGATKLFQWFGTSFISRQNEYMADQMAVQCGLGEELKHALLAIHDESVEDVTEAPGKLQAISSYFSECFASHPSCKNRIEAINYGMRQSRPEDLTPFALTSIPTYVWDSISETLSRMRSEHTSHFRGIEFNSQAL